MKTTLLLLTLLSHSAFSQSMGLAELLDQTLNHTSLDALTRSPETMNKATILHLGKNSAPVRKKLLSEAKHHVFITIPYWFKDQTGWSLYHDLKKNKELNPSLDVKVMVDFVSPASTRDFFGLKQYKDLKNTFGSENVIQWNKLWNFKRFSAKIWTNRLHDKITVIDSEKLLMGGMNMGDDYLLGGIDRKGWHDTDILFEGPVAVQGTEIFLKPFLFQHHADRFFEDTAHDDRMELKLLQYFFYFNKAKVAFGKGNTSVFEVPYMNFVKNENYFPVAKGTDPDQDVPVRLIYDNPLVDRTLVPVAGKKGVFETRKDSKLLNTLEFIMPNVKKSLRAFIPYPTISDRVTKILTTAARRGVKVEIITNSLASHDLGPKFYKAGLPRIKELIEAGVDVYEWQGHKSLERFEHENNCTIDSYWPGNRLHTKVIILDNEVAFIGSHNLNTRSEKHNTEITSLVRSKRIANGLNDIFEYDLDKGEKTIQCGGKLFGGRPPRTYKVDLEELKDIYDFKKLEKMKKYYDFI